MNSFSSEAAVCHGCGANLDRKVVSYRLRIDLFASPEPPELTAEELAGDLRAQWEALVEAMSAMSDAEVEEATDQVHESYEFKLCGACRAMWHARLKEFSTSAQPGGGATPVE